jgi:hypothetical protein
VHQVDAGHTLGQRLAKHPARPDDRLAVGGDELAAVDDSPQLLVVLEAHQLRRVDSDVLALPPRRDRLLDDLDGLVKRDGVDPATENVRPKLVPAGLDLVLAYTFGDCFPQGLSLPVA